MSVSKLKVALLDLAKLSTSLQQLDLSCLSHHYNHNSKVSLTSWPLSGGVMILFVGSAPWAWSSGNSLLRIYLVIVILMSLQVWLAPFYRCVAKYIDCKSLWREIYMLWFQFEICLRWISLSLFWSDGSKSWMLWKQCKYWHFFIILQWQSVYKNDKKTPRYQMPIFQYGGDSILLIKDGNII